MDVKVIIGDAYNKFGIEEGTHKRYIGLRFDDKNLSSPVPVAHAVISEPPEFGAQQEARRPVPVMAASAFDHR